MKRTRLHKGYRYFNNNSPYTPDAKKLKRKMPKIAENHSTTILRVEIDQILTVI